MSILLMVPDLRYWHEYDPVEKKKRLQKLVPEWPSLNDALYWASIEQTRRFEAEKSGNPLIDDWAVSWQEHFWQFDKESLPRLIEFMRSRILPDDRLVALSTAVRIYIREERPTAILNDLEVAVADEPILQQRFDILLNPSISENIKRPAKKKEEHDRKQKEEKEQKQLARDAWIAKLRISPDLVRSPSDLLPGELSKDQYLLMLQLHGRRSATSRSDYADWQALIPDFGEVVARAYRDAAVNHWRHYLPKLRSEGAECDSTPFSLVFAMAGLEIEASENAEFPRGLDDTQVRHGQPIRSMHLPGRKQLRRQHIFSFLILLFTV